MLQLSQKILSRIGTAPKENFARRFLRLPAFPLEHVPEKLPTFSVLTYATPLILSSVPIDQMSPFDRDAL